eukprot:TRINITY_DN75652_c0_g1_i1.p2 TRINITY_DN75652_c0_g1~~TRINITY_DN75652_c0_g1_i1.p2  ORF type:complete len:293 (+),score=59.66 TRINITY_DN75652_c0_g1_i1:95-880(+)
MRPTQALLAKRRRPYLVQLKHRLMGKVYAAFNSFGPEMRITFETNQEMWLMRLDTQEGEAQAGGFVQAEADQFNADYQAANIARRTPGPVTTAVEVLEMNLSIPPGELPFYCSRSQVFYDADRKMKREVVAPFWWKTIPGDEGLAANRPIYYTGEGTNDYLEPTLKAVMQAEDKGARFLPATPEEAAEIEAEEQYNRDVRNSMIQAVADLQLVEVPPYYIAGQKNWMTVTPWYKAKKTKGTLTEQEDGAPTWNELVSWKTV